MMHITLRHSRQHAQAFAIGILLSDMLYAAAVYHGMSIVQTLTKHHETLGIISGIICIGIGIGMLTAQKKETTQDTALLMQPSDDRSSSISI
jgi:threonine/homoserine/homoserine lactone efflux protein